MNTSPDEVPRPDQVFERLDYLHDTQPEAVETLWSLLKLIEFLHGKPVEGTEIYNDEGNEIFAYWESKSSADGAYRTEIRLFCDKQHRIRCLARLVKPGSREPAYYFQYAPLPKPEQPEIVIDGVTYQLVRKP